jgi:energy-converting hydrogenase Eha subunit A
MDHLIGKIDANPLRDLKGRQEVAITAADIEHFLSGKNDRAEDPFQFSIVTCVAFPAPVNATGVPVIEIPDLFGGRV